MENDALLIGSQKWRLNNLYHIIDEQGKDVLFTMRPSQKMLYAVAFLQKKRLLSIPGFLSTSLVKKLQRLKKVRFGSAVKSLKNETLQGLFVIF